MATELQRNASEFRVLMGSPKSALLTSNIKLTEYDGKSLRLLSLAEIAHKAGCKVTLIVDESNLRRAGKFQVIETKSPLRDTLGDDPLKKMRHSIKQLIGLLSFYAKLLLLRADYDIIASSLAGFEIDSMLACILSKIKRTPFVYDYDDPSPELRIAFYGCSANDPRVRLSRFTRNILIRNASLVLTASDSVRHQIVENFENAKVRVWYNLPRMDGIRVTEDKQHLREKLGLKADSFVVSYLGRVPSWGIAPFADALKRFMEDFGPDENVLFLIIGGGKWEEHFCRIAKELGHAERLIITGMRQRQNALEYLMASDVSCIPFATSLASRHIVPTKLFEAMALGIPVLCSQSANYFKILGDDGIYFDGDTHGLTQKIRWCLANRKKLEKISYDLKSKFVHEYSWDKRSHAMENALRLLLQLPTEMT